MNHPGRKHLENLSKETLMEVIEMYSRSWVTLDGLWFSGVEEKFGLDTAMELDVRMWEIGSKIEARRVKDLFGFSGGIENVLRTIDMMVWASTLGYEYHISDNRAVWTCRNCPPQKQRKSLGKVELPCKPTFEACFNNVIQVVDPRVKVECLFCPPDAHPDDAWCQWLFSIPEA